MEVIYRGTPPSEEVWIGTCYSCKSVVEAKQNELKIESDQRDGTWGEAKCPVCESRMTFSKK